MTMASPMTCAAIWSIPVAGSALTCRWRVRAITRDTHQLLIAVATAGRPETVSRAAGEAADGFFDQLAREIGPEAPYRHRQRLYPLGETIGETAVTDLDRDIRHRLARDHARQHLTRQVGQDRSGDDVSIVTRRCLGRGIAPRYGRSRRRPRPVACHADRASDAPPIPA